MPDSRYAIENVKRWTGHPLIYDEQLSEHPNGAYIRATAYKELLEVTEEMALMLGWSIDWIESVGEIPLGGLSHDEEESEAHKRFVRANEALAKFRASVSGDTP